MHSNFSPQPFDLGVAQLRLATIVKDHEGLVDAVISIASLTNVTDLQYKKELQLAQEMGRELMNFEYRALIISS